MGVGPGKRAIQAPAADRSAALKAALPDALRLLVERCGLHSLRSASRQVVEATGSSLTPMTLSLWTRGQATPSFDNLVDFLAGLDLELRDLARALDEVIARSRVEADELAKSLAERLRRDPVLRQGMRTLVEQTSTAPAGAPAAGLLALLDEVEQAESAEKADDDDTQSGR